MTSPIEILILWCPAATSVSVRNHTIKGWVTGK